MKSRVAISEAVLRAVSELEIRSVRNVASLLAGNYRSAFRGSGMQFKEFRHYEPGDDIRHMSWPVTARTGRPTLKVYEEERELDVVLLVDCSGSSLFGSQGKRRIDMYAELVALIGLAAIRSGDNLGLLLFNEEPSLYLPPAKSRDHVLVALTQLLSAPLESRRSHLNKALAYAQRVLKNRSLIIVLSDFLVPTFERELTMTAKKHELILLHCFDEAERGNNLQGVYEICDPETGDFFLLDGNSKKTKSLLAEHQAKLESGLRTVCRSSNSDYFALSVEDDYLTSLVHYFRRRGPARV